MARYSKQYSNYILRKKHQNVDGGVIVERDWGTLGERHVIESGKRPIYSDTNFLFTDNSRKGTRKRNYSGEWSETFNLDNLSTKVNDDVNTIKLTDSNDLRDYAYWGSAEELLRSGVENIVKWFPGRVWSDGFGLTRVDTNGNTYYLQKIVGDGHCNFLISYIDKNDLEVPCECATFGCGDDNNTYTTPDNGCCVDFADADSVERGDDCAEFIGNEDCIVEPESDCDNTYHIFTLKNPFQINFYDKNLALGKNDNQMRFLALSWKQYVLNDELVREYSICTKPYEECLDDYSVRFDIKLTTDTRVSHIYGLHINGNLVWCTDTQNLVLQPRYFYIEEYFSNLTGIEKVLLPRDTNPLYSARFITPIERTDGNYTYVEKPYVWPSNDYCIDVESMGFNSYINKLYSLGRLLDELWCNNLWENMTHEAVKNYDWTYQMEYEDGDDVDNIDGGGRMERMVKLCGAHFDDMKRYVDNIGKVYDITRDGVGNAPNAQMSDKAELNGWEVYSTKNSENGNESIDTNFLNYIVKKPGRWSDSTINHGKWYTKRNYKTVDENYNDNYFMRNLVLNSAEIFRTKGTVHSIEMVMAMFGIGEEDYDIKQIYYTTIPKRADDPMYYYILNENIEMDTPYGYTVMTGFTSLNEYIVSLGGVVTENEPQNICFESDGLYMHYDKKYMTTASAVEYANLRKGFDVDYYDNPYSGIPVGDVYLNNEHYLVPMFSQGLIYDGDVQFETNGGWGKFVGDGDTLATASEKKYDYLETISYIEVLQNCSHLTEINMFDIGERRQFYVMDLSDYASLNPDLPPDGNLSNYFKLVDIYNPQEPASWRCVPMFVIINGTKYTVAEVYDEDREAFAAYCNGISAFQGITYEDYLLADYYDKLQPDNLGNNPHVGNAKYDLGTEYYNYLSLPFYYALTKGTIADNEAQAIAENFHYKISTVTTILTRGEGYEDGKVKNLIESDSNVYYIPSKIMIIKNNISNSQDVSGLYKEYLNKVVLKYLLQVIPSTTILLLENFK